MEPEFALRMELFDLGGIARVFLLQWSRSLHSGWNSRCISTSLNRRCFNGAGVCTPDGTFSTVERLKVLYGFNGAGVCTPDGTEALESASQPEPASMEPEFALRMELFPQNSKGKQALQTAFSSTRTERANLPFHPARGKKKFLYSC